MRLVHVTKGPHAVRHAVSDRTYKESAGVGSIWTECGRCARSGNHMIEGSFSEIDCETCARKVAKREGVQRKHRANRVFAVSAEPQTGMYMTTELAAVDPAGTESGVSAQVMQAVPGMTILLWVRTPDGKVVREKMNLAPLVAPWIQAIEADIANGIVTPT